MANDICPECGIDWDIDYNDDCGACLSELGEIDLEE